MNSLPRFDWEVTMEKRGFCRVITVVTVAADSRTDAIETARVEHADQGEPIEAYCLNGDESDEGYTAFHESSAELAQVAYDER